MQEAIDLFPKMQELINLFLEEPKMACLFLLFSSEVAMMPTARVGETLESKYLQILFIVNVYLMY